MVDDKKDATPDFWTLGASKKDKSGKILVTCVFPYQPKAEYDSGRNYAFDVSGDEQDATNTEPKNGK